MQRQLEPEWLDQLSPYDPAAIDSRRDLRKINLWMGHAPKMARAVQHALVQGRRIHSIVDLGAGDANFLLRLVQRLGPVCAGANLILIDRHNAVDPEVEAQLNMAGLQTTFLSADALEWLHNPSIGSADLVFANLFLHHFRDDQLGPVFDGIAKLTSLFVACEPRRSALALFASRLVSWIGCNYVTDHDAIVSVRAGFADRELSALWPEPANWRLNEYRSGIFTHCFAASRR